MNRTNAAAFREIMTRMVLHVMTYVTRTLELDFKICFLSLLRSIIIMSLLQVHVYVHVHVHNITRGHLTVCTDKNFCSDYIYIHVTAKQGTQRHPSV